MAAHFKRDLSESESDSDESEDGTPHFSPKKQRVDTGGTYFSPKKQRVDTGGTHFSPKKQRDDTSGTYFSPKKQRVDTGGTYSSPKKQRVNTSIGKSMYNPIAEKMMAKMGYKEGTGLGKNAQGRVNIVEASMQRGRRGLGYTIKGFEIEWNPDNDPAKMGYKEGTGLGKNAQGRVSIVEASMQRGRRGLGYTINGFEPSMDVEWNADDDPVIIDETVEWLPRCKEKLPPLDTLRDWKIVGEKKKTLDNENSFCSEGVLEGVLSCKSIFDNLEPEEKRKARTRSNPYETIRRVFFLNRAAMKMANMDAVLDFMFTSPKYADKRPMVRSNDLLYFADICAGPGGFSEYVLWRTEGEAKGFGLTLRAKNDFKLENFFAGPPEMFEPHYGVGGNKGDGDIFNPYNQAEFIKYVLQNTRNHDEDEGVHMVMADGGFSNEGKENIHAMLSKQLFLCQFLVAISILKTGGNFVCKLFDLYTPFSVGLVYLMNQIFEQVSIYKPVTSRPANSERYIVCKGVVSKSEREPVRQYFHEINLDLNKYLSSASKSDINHIVPMETLQGDEDFYNYICESNDSLGRIQILNLQKVKAFTQNTSLCEHRQTDVRATLLDKWKVPDVERTAPEKSVPNEKVKDLVKDDMSYFDHVVEKLSLENLKEIKSVYDYRCLVAGDVPEKHVFILGLGRTVVYQRVCSPQAHWVKLQDNLKLELPRDTLLEAEIVMEYKGEGPEQRKIMTLHVLDALFLYGKDVRDLNYNERMEKLRKFTKSITKLTRSDLVRVVVPEIYRFEQLDQIFKQLLFKKVKGGGPGEKLCYSPKYNPENRFYRPTGVYIIRTVRDPWTMQVSKSNRKKYFFNSSDGQSVFDCPKESNATVRDTKMHSFHWAWEEGVKLLDGQPGKNDDTKLSKDTVMEYLRRLPH